MNTDKYIYSSTAASFSTVLRYLLYLSLLNLWSVAACETGFISSAFDMSLYGSSMSHKCPVRCHHQDCVNLLLNHFSCETLNVVEVIEKRMKESGAETGTI